MPPSADPPPNGKRGAGLSGVHAAVALRCERKVQDDFDPNLIVLVRRVRVRPTLIFQGKVEGDPIVAQATPPPAVKLKPPGKTPR